MIGELWDGPQHERPDDELDEEAEAFDEEPEPDDELETWKMIRRYAPGDDELGGAF